MRMKPQTDELWLLFAFSSSPFSYYQKGWKSGSQQHGRTGNDAKRETDSYCWRSGSRLRLCSAITRS